MLELILGGGVLGCCVSIYNTLKNSKQENVKTKEEWREFLACVEITNKAKQSIAFVKQEPENNFVLFRCPYGISEEDIVKKEVYFKKFLNATRVEYEVKDIWLRMYYYIEELPEVVPFELVPRTSKDIEVFLGVGYNEYAIINFNKTPHVLLAGATNSGKSIATHVMLVQLYRCYKDFRFYLADMKKVELIDYKFLPQTEKYADTLEGVSEMVQELLDECDRRYQLIGSIGCKKMETYNEKVTKDKRLQPIIFVIEECVRLISDSKLQKQLAELLFIARACGIYCILTIQRPTKACLSPEIKASLGNIIGLKTVNQKNSECICDDNRLKKLRGFGHGWLFNDFGEVEYQGYYIQEHEITEYLACLKK